MPIIASIFGGAAVAGTAAAGTTAAVGTGAAAFGGITAGASITAGTIGAASAATVGAGIGIGATAAAAAGTGLTFSGVMGGIMTGLSLAGTAMSAYGSFQQGQVAAAAQRSSSTIGLAQADYNRSVSDYNATVNESNAANVRMVAQVNADTKREKLKKLMGSQALAFAAAGVEIGSGSSLEVQLAQMRNGELDILTSVRTSEFEAMEYDRKARFQRIQGNAAYQVANLNYDAGMTQAAAYEDTGTINAGTGILLGAAKTYRAATGKVSGYELIG